MQSFQFLVYKEKDVKREKRRWKIEYDLEVIMDGNYVFVENEKLSKRMNDSNFNAGKFPKTDI